MNEKIKEYIQAIPAVADAACGRETFWLNDRKRPEQIQGERQVSSHQIEDAGKRLERFAPYIAKEFPETAGDRGIIESELREIPDMKRCLNGQYRSDIRGRLFLKMDSHLPISGSVKARGGIYEVLKHSEDLAMAAGLLREEDDYSILAGPGMKDFFSRYTIQVGSTGNLGLSIGIMGASLGFRVIVHMSADAKQWKKDLLRSRGVTVVEYEGDYCAAVEEGRRNSDNDPMSYFVDDENSLSLFFGYAAAGERVKKQLEEKNIRIDRTHPLFVYLPCGIGGAPGGVAYGLKEIYGDAVHCFFTEPVQSCCMLLGMATGEHDNVCVQDFGISGKTDADGLAVGRPSAFVGRVIEPRLAGICTIEDKKLYGLMRALLKTEDIFIEPSACASFAAFLQSGRMEEYVVKEGLKDCMDHAVHIAWATGGSMVPEAVMEEYLNK